MSLNVPSGYKQTKVGVIPEDWGTYRIDNVLQRIRKKVEVEKEVLYQQIGIRSHAKGIFHKELVSGEALGSKSVFWIEGDCFIVNIVFAWEQAVAKTTEVEKGMIASHRFPMYKAKDNKVDIDYILYFFKSKRGKHLLGLASPGGAGRNKTLGQKEFSELKLPLPSLKEQQKIAQILTTWDDAISKQEAIIKAKEQLKKGLMQRLLSGEIRFDGFDGEWEEVRLGDVAQINPKNPKLPSSFVYIDLESVKNGLLLKETLISNSEAPSRAQRLLQINDILFQMVRPYQKNNLYFTLEGDYVASTGYAQIRALSSSQYLYHYLHWDKFVNKVLLRCTGTGYPVINSKDLGKIKVKQPSNQEQQKIAQVLTTADKEIELLKEEIETLKEQKRGLMQRLLSGVVRVKG